MDKQLDTAFLVLVNTDGTFSVQLDPAQITEWPTTARQATQYDVLTTSEAIIKELDTQALVNRIVGTLAELLMPPAPPTAADAVKDALKERGIDPESVKPTE